MQSITRRPGLWLMPSEPSKRIRKPRWRSSSANMVPSAQVLTSRPSPAEIVKPLSRMSLKGMDPWGRPVWPSANRSLLPLLDMQWRGGLELALWCDLRVMEEEAILGVFCRRWGVPLIDGGTIRLPRLIGLGQALDLIITGRPVTAQEALSMGLVNRVVPKGKAREAAEKLALEVSSFPQACLNTDRMSAYFQWDLPLEEALRNEFEKGFPMVEAEGRSGAARFAGGAGRRGKF